MVKRHDDVANSSSDFETPVEYDDDDNENDSYGEEEDEDVPAQRKGPKKKKRKINSLIDFEAEEEDAEDEEEDDEVGVKDLIADDDADDAVNREHEQMKAQRLEFESNMRDNDPREMERYLLARFGDDADYEEADAPDTSHVDQQSLLPTIKDPRLWVVRCTKIGHERRAVFSLLQKMFNLRRKGHDLGIFSAVAPEHLKGRIYIEAFHKSQVELALSGMELFSTYGGITALPLDEMPDVLKLGKRAEKQSNGNWVRVKNTKGPYKGDLAQVCNVRDGQSEGQITIRMIPRLDLKGEKDYIENLDRDDRDPKDNSITRRKGRPPQKLFNKKELYRLTGSVDVSTQRDRMSGELYDVWNDERYRFGLLYKTVSVKSVITGDAVQPTVEELEKWLMAEKHMQKMYEEDPTTMDAEEAERGLGLDIGSVAGKKISNLFKGDAVRVLKGEQKGVEGTVSSFEGDQVLIKIPDIPIPLRVGKTDITRLFQVGEHVKVSSGKRAGSVGAIVRVDGEFLTIFTDSTREEVKVLSSEVAESSDLNGDHGTGSGGASNSQMRYELFDLVQILSDPNERGVIIQVQNDALTLLTAQNSRRSVPLNDIKGKVKDDSVRAIDMRRNPIAPNDTIHVSSGPLNNRKGVVKHVAGNIVFFKAHDEVNNCGMLAVVASACTAITAAQRLGHTAVGVSGMKPPAGVPRGSIPSLGRMSGGRGGGAGRDPLHRKEVKVRKGPYKGYIGRVVDTTDSKVRVELISKMKTIMISRNDVRSLDGTVVGVGPRNSHPNSGMANRIVEPQSARGSANNRGPPSNRTPRAQLSGFQNRTPYNESYGGSRTPRQGSATPRVLPMPMTPGPPGTPGRDDFRPADEVPPPYANYANPRTPSGDFPGYTTPFANVPTTPATPAGSGMPTTPAGGGYGMEPRTPAGLVEPNTPAYSGMEPKTPAPGLEPATPGPGYEPQTPAPAHEPRTPAPSMEPSTPMIQEPATPHTPANVPQTPNPQEEAANELGYRVLIDVEVLVKGENNFNATVVDASPDGSFIMVRMLAGDAKGKEIEVPIGDITPVQPRADVGEQPELVKVLDGPHAARQGRLMSVTDVGEDREGAIRFADGLTATLNMCLVAKCSEEI